MHFGWRKVISACLSHCCHSSHLFYRLLLFLKKWDIVTTFTSQKLETHRWSFLSMVCKNGTVCLCKCSCSFSFTNPQILFNLLTEKEDGAISTIVLRGSTDNLMDDVERAVDDGVNTFKVLTRVSISSNLNWVICKVSKLQQTPEHFENFKMNGCVKQSTLFT